MINQSRSQRASVAGATAASTRRGDVAAADFAEALLGFLSAARRTRGRFQPLFHDITVPQLVLLDAVEACGRLGVEAVATYTGLTQPTVTRGAAALAQAGLLHRDEAKHDRRARILMLTPQGRRQLAAKRAVVAAHLATLWDGLDAAERVLAIPLLGHLTALVDQLA
jgi:DNA-binding MarR family transcriptional regulator